MKVDDREQMTPGFKFNDWELRGVPLRIEIGPRDVKNRQVVLARRDVPGRDGKSFVPMDGLAAAVRTMLDTIQEALYQRAVAFREANTFHPETYGDFCEAVGKGFAHAWWCGASACEDKVKEETKATTRNIPLEQPGGAGRCIVCGAESKEMAVWARSY